MSADGPSPRARNLKELGFFVSLQSCPTCGQRLDEDLFDYKGNEVGGAMTGKCRHCRAQTFFPVRVRGDVLRSESGDTNELAPGTSDLIAPYKFIDEVVALSPTVNLDPSTLRPRDWQQNRLVNKRTRVCLTELRKMVPPGADRISESLMTDEDRRRFAAHEEPYLLAWIEPLLQRHVRVTDANIADLPRINMLEAEEAKLLPKGIDYIEREALDAHEKWVERGMKGRGRLVLVQAQHRGLKIGRGAILSGAVLYDCDLAEVYLEDVKLEKAELTMVRFDEAKLYGSYFHDATLKEVSFKKADLSLAEFKNTRIEAGDFFNTLLDLSEWPGATVSNTSFETATFGNANLDGAVFRNCNFKGADFNASDPEPPPTTRARFEDCDLTGSSWVGRDIIGAVFVRCTGRPE